ncbi:P63C domain-containing protein [Palleronia sp. KMU-117]|uniref:P63C domain-containing protein n=1 Tax=Palleronia sp. KMU-117 TaxID=3434108 RepID=UPI003D73D2A1
MLALKRSPQRMGGEARAKALDPQKRAEIARKAAAARWEGKDDVPDQTELPVATHQGSVNLGGLALDCYVLADGRRVFHKRGMARALGMRSAGGNAFVKTIQRKGLSSQIDRELAEKIDNPFYFRALNGDIAHGYDAEILVEVCKAIMRAQQNGNLTSAQEPLAEQARVLLNAFAKVGVTALIDEATGFQEIRHPDALRLLVDQYIEEEKREWAKEFPDDYYDELNRIFGSKRLTHTKSGRVVQNRPQHFAKFTRSYVYHPLENGAVLEELDRINPKFGKNGNRRARFHQHLSEGYGLQKLKIQVQEVLTLMKISDNVSQFKKLFEKRFSRSYQPDLFDT